jgi:signal peptidase II
MHRSPAARAALTLGIVVACDQLAKRAVEHSIVPGEEQKFFPGVTLVYSRNHGVAFGLQPGSNAGVSVLIAIALAVLLVYFVRHRSERLMWLPTGMLFGGAIGNLIDRIRLGSVTDFIKLPLGWPPFNIADASITLGVLTLFLLVDHHRRARE